MKILCLDHPVLDTAQIEYRTSANMSPSQHVMRVLPSFEYSPNHNVPFDLEVAYVTPLLAFNLGLHVSSLKVLLHGGQESLNSLFEVEASEMVEGKRNEDVNVVLVTWPNLPRYASHLRISFIKMPECGVLESLKGNSKIEVDDRQDMIDSALNDYFKVDRYVTKGDVFCVQIDWRCNSEMCFFCSKNSTKLSNNLMYFKVRCPFSSSYSSLR